jgi:hypothetical protein
MVVPCQLGRILGRGRFGNFSIHTEWGAVSVVWHTVSYRGYRFLAKRHFEDTMQFISIHSLVNRMEELACYHLPLVLNFERRITFVSVELCLVLVSQFCFFCVVAALRKCRGQRQRSRYPISS